MGTKAPYYGNIAVAAMLGNTATTPATVAHIPLSGASSAEAAYAAYEGGPGSQKLARVMVLNMNTYNTTEGGEGLVPVANPPCRGRRSYTFSVPAGTGSVARVQRLWADGSDAISGISWDGTSYNYELDDGKPVVLTNVTWRGEMVAVVDGKVTVSVGDSSAAMLSFD
jgi:hypothetical protein